MKRHVARVCLLLVLSVEAVAAADETAPEDEQRRTLLFKEGRSLGDAGKWSEAADKFREVVAIRSAPKALIALAIAEERQGHLAAAKRLYEKARFDARLTDLKAEEETASQALRQLAPRVPGVSLRIPPDVRGVSVTVDGKPADLEGGEIDLDPGERALVVSAPGRTDFQATVSVVEGKRSELTVSFPVGATAKPGGEVADTGGIGLPPLGAMILGGVGVAAGVTGVVLLAVGKGQERGVVDACGGTECPLSLKPEADASAAKIIAGDVMLGLGGAALIGGGVWWFLSRGKPKAQADSPANEARVTFGPAPRGAWISVQSTF